PSRGWRRPWSCPPRPAASSRPGPRRRARGRGRWSVRRRASSSAPSPGRARSPPAAAARRRADWGRRRPCPTVRPSPAGAADAKLRQEIEEQYPALWERIQKRRLYMREELNIELKEELLPLCSTLAYYRPFFLNPNLAMALK